MKNILVTGANGQLGKEFQEIHKGTPYTFFFTDIETLDITDATQIERFIKQHKINIIINCAAYTAVDKAESEKDLAMKINATAVKNLAEISAKNKAILIHVSTDYVFNGKHFKPYTENDTTQPTSVYGRTKFEGEIEMLFNTTQGIIIRTSWLYSPHGNNFVKTMMRLGKEQKHVNVVYDQIGTPTYALDLAKAILELLPNTEKLRQTEIYNFSNEGVCSWYDFAKEIMEIARLNCMVLPIESKDFPTPTARPHYSVLNKSKFKLTFKQTIPYWKDSLKDCIKRIN